MLVDGPVFFVLGFLSLVGVGVGEGSIEAVIRLELLRVTRTGVAFSATGVVVFLAVACSAVCLGEAVFGEAAGVLDAAMLRRVGLVFSVLTGGVLTTGSLFLRERAGCWRVAAGDIGKTESRLLLTFA